MMCFQVVRGGSPGWAPWLRRAPAWRRRRRRRSRSLCGSSRRRCRTGTRCSYRRSCPGRRWCSQRRRQPLMLLAGGMAVRLRPSRQKFALVDRMIWWLTLFNLPPLR
ncbi:hypothetical protein PVAP13_6KG278106 [Panicum virgatum]|uniref:Uncharacterized protein n=1 Tax=Panicum virgatum TaxID=38727 RepID=A0A8T0RGA8_PANVG|nr:hypothetical protein PVAP13_6KG278106 [Panicum virgatum]